MLYRTHHHPSIFTFNPFSPSSPSPHLISSPSPPPSPLQGMESVQGAMRNGFGTETAAKTAAAAVDDFDFFVDELLDFSNDFPEAGEQPEQTEEKGPEKEKDSPVSPGKTAAPENGGASVKDEVGSFAESELSVPAVGLESLEWLSHFVEDSFSEFSLTGKMPPKPPAENRSEVEVTVNEQPRFSSPVQTKARTKRARSGVRVWPVLSPSFKESSTSSSSSTSSTTSAPYRLVLNQTRESLFITPPAKKGKKKPADAVSPAGGGTGGQRRCSHCGVTKTPQWRAGPLGSKTLCNACGVRYKSGRLLPEYRPACSPTFSSELHSNNHRKVLEMRRKKETEMEAAGLPPPVQSF